MTTINIRMNPQAKQSFKFTRTGIKYQPKEVKESKANMQAQMIMQIPAPWKPLTGGILIRNLQFKFPPLKSFSKYKMDVMSIAKLYKTTRPDLDNLLKNLWDSCNGLLWLDDSQICVVENLKKIYWHTPGIYMEFEEI